MTQPEAVRLLITAANDFKVAMKAVNEGEVFKLLSKPWSLDELRSAITQAVEYHRLIQDNKRLDQRDRRAQRASSPARTPPWSSRSPSAPPACSEGMIRALDYRDTETQWHSWRVARFTRRIAEGDGHQRARQLMHIEQGALLHDIGKIGVRDAILLKPGPLTPEEWVEMKKHPGLGFRMLQNIPYLQDRGGDRLPAPGEVERAGLPARPQGRGDLPSGPGCSASPTPWTRSAAIDPTARARRWRWRSPRSAGSAGTQFDPKAVETYLGIPPSEWMRIRHDIEHLEQVDRRRITGEMPVIKV